uniref:Tetraspanin n=1 Tax=Rhabditophanes sp. KR3021 TaxID=114890 RepID=A0AC35TT26_9BILA
MVYGCGNQLIKLFVFVSNFLIFFFGGIIFAFSLWANLDSKFSVHLRDYCESFGVDNMYADELSKYEASLWVLVGISAILIVIGFLGCCGACTENNGLLTMYTITLFVLTIIQVGAVVMALVSRPEFEEMVHNALKMSVKDGGTRKQLMPIEQIFKCCGATSDTKAVFVANNDCPEGFDSMPDCYTAITDVIQQKSDVIAVVGILLLIIQFFGMIFSCVLCKAFGERGPSYYA